MNTSVAERQATSTSAAMNAGADLEKIQVAQVLAKLNVQPGQGLTTAEAKKRLGQYGPNAIVEKERSLLSKIAGYFVGPIAFMIEAAAVVSAILGHWQNFIIISAVLGFFAVVQSFGLLLIGMKALSDPSLQLFGLHDQNQLQTVMFLQLVAGGHLLLFVTRTEKWFFLPPFPAAPLFLAIVATQILAILMCAFGWLVPPISWEAIGGVWAYNLIWMFVLCGVRLVTQRLIDNRTAKRLRSAEIVNKALHPHGPVSAVLVGAKS